MAENKRILFCWVGGNDLKASGKAPDGAGPIANALDERDFDLAVLLSNYDKKQTNDYLRWLKKKVTLDIELHYAKLTSPTNLGEIYEIVTEKIATALDNYGDNTKLTFHVSPGTPSMAAIWILLAKTRFNAQLIESSIQFGVKNLEAPFDISAEFIPDLLRRRDNEIEDLALVKPDPTAGFDEIIHQSREMKNVIRKAVKVAPRYVPILIEGESGTGKELLARAIHNQSDRKDNEFIAVNCGAIPKDLMESEFFGHKKGAFTGANADRKGHFESADKGTLFLDEIGEMPLEIQVKLLRVIQEKEVTRIGESQGRKIDVRIISATNRNLINRMSTGDFRDDLFHRLAVGFIKLPPLRKRAGDLGLLIDHLLKKIIKENAAEPDWRDKKISVKGKNILLQHHWPGNVRELYNTLMRAFLWSNNKTISEDDIKEAIYDLPTSTPHHPDLLNHSLDNNFDLQAFIENIEKHYIERALKETGGHLTHTADLLGLNNYQTLNHKISKYEIK